ncbi:Predicted N-acetyltransferase YhbS [Thalassobacillus cyri]|uniref:Predicted N-acetyltransferase YhbS n=1 Tax=Thalassobacillus cyri TaxID=571932 RepID=A0A1H3ZJY2_9BACI|nr:GNAT family N-acetyltransferase [Thalassobacillus cyri]SEA23731.1 Predicted N-acetyltransferase YhbS [Thalassobacillus cyri]
MTNVDFPGLEKGIVIRKITPDDIEEVAALSDNSFGPDISFKRDHFASQAEIFPEGQLCVEYEGKIVGSCSSLIVNFDDYKDKHDYEAISDKGYIRNHNPEGVNLYGVEVSVHPDYRKLKLGRRLYDARKKVCKNLGLKSIIIGGRIPYYYKHADEMSAEEYAEKVVNKELYDPVLTFQANNGFVLRGVIPNYLPDDDASLGYATSMEWFNEDYRRE